MRINSGRSGKGSEKSVDFLKLAFRCFSSWRHSCLPLSSACHSRPCDASVCAAHCTAEWACVGLTCDLNAHHTRKLTTRATASVLVCVCVYLQDKYKSSLLLFPFFASALSLVFRHPPQGTLRAAPVPMTTSPLLSITKAISYSFALYMVPFQDCFLRRD